MFILGMLVLTLQMSNHQCPSREEYVIVIYRDNKH